MGRRRKRTSRRSSEQHYELQVPAVGISVDERQPDAAQAAAAAAVQAAPSSVRAALRAQQARAIPESASSSSGGGALNPDLDCSSDGSSSSSSGASDDTSASSRRDALVRCCCARPRSNAQARRQRRPQRRQTRQLNSSSTAGKVRAQFSELDGGGGGGCASANRAESESASREQSRASKSAFARLRLRERNAQAVEPPKRARARVRKFNVGNAGSLSASKRGPEVGPSETAQGAAESENATPSSDGQAAAAFASESKSTRNGRSKRKGKGASLPRRANSKGSSWSSKASSFGPKVRIDLDFGARSSREGYARALLAHCWRRQSKLSERREEEEEERDAPCKFKAASRRVSCAQVPPGARVNEASPFATAGAPLALTHESDQERVANWQARRSETDVATADVRRDGTGSGTKNASLFAADTSSDGSSGGRRIICSRGGGDSSEWNLHVTEQTFTSGGGSSRDAMRFQVRESSLGLCVRKDKTLDNGQARALSTASELDAQPTRSDLDKLSQAYAGEATAAFASADIELGTAAAAAAVPLASCKANGLRTKRANSCASVRNKVPECSRVLALICETRTEMHAHEATCAIGIRQRKHSTASTAAAATQAAVRRAGALRLAQQQQQQQEKSCFCYSPSSSSPSSSPSRRRRERGDKAVCPSKSPTASIEQLKSLAKEIDNKLAYLGDDERRRASLHEAVSGQQRKARPQVLKCWTTRSQKFEVRGSGGGGGGDDGQVRQSASASFARKRLSLQTFEVDVEDHKIISTSLHEGNLHQAKLSRSTTNSSLCYSTYHSPSFIREIEEVRESLLDSANESQESISASSSTETIITTATYKTAPSTTEGSTPTRKEKSNMVSFVELDSSHESTSGDASTLAAAAAAAATTKQMSNLAALHMDSVEMEEDEELQQESTSSDGVSGAARPKQKPQQQQQQQQQKQKSGQLITSLELDDDLDEEQLKRILACKRLSEGNCASAVAAMQHLVQRPSMQSAFCRKNSLHMIGESLPPVTEGEPMRHMSHHMSSQNMGAAAGGGHQQAGCSGSTSGSSSTASSLRSKQLACKRNSQDDNTASCSSSTSLDGGSSSGAASVGLRSPSRRRSSTVSQCSSVLSEGTRQQLNFDLSPDLAPDSSLLEANTISPTDFDRPASPEPSSPGADDAEDDSSSFDMRPISRMSAFYCDEIMLTASPDSTLGDSNDNNNPNLTNNNNNNNNNNNSHFATINQQQQQQQQQAQTQQIEERQRHDANIRDNLERIISHVSTVRVSGTNEAAATTTTTRGDSHEQQLDNGDDGAGAPVAGQKRAHTPFGLNVQRNKTTLMSPPTPSPTAPADSKAGCE